MANSSFGASSSFSNKYMQSLREDAPATNYAGSYSNGGPPHNASSIADPMKKPAPVADSHYQDSLHDHLAGGATRSVHGQDLPGRRMSITSTFSGRFTDLHHNQTVLLGTKRPRPHKIWKKKYIKVLVVGDSGLGKTTLIKTLLSTPGERLQVHDGSYTPGEVFRKDPESLCSTVTWKDEEDRVIWVYRIQDTPGYGDDLDTYANLKLMLDYMQKQNRKWLEMEQSKSRTEDLQEVEDMRVDICLFCIPPHRLRPIDLKYMYELGQCVPILPVITKADTMTIREANLYRQEVANKIQNPMVQGIKDKINVFHFDRETLERAGVSDAGSGNIPPFLVIASNDINEELNLSDTPMLWPERRYPWGTAEAFNPEHSDLLSLRALLMKEALEEISKTKRSRYETWRRKVLGGVRVVPKLQRFLALTVVPMAICLYLGRSGTSWSDIKKGMSGAVNNVKKSVGLAPKAKPAPAPAGAPAKKGW